MATPYSPFLIGSITWYSVLIVLGILLAYFIGTAEEKRVGLPRDTMIDVTLVAVPCGVLGARLYYVAMEWSWFSRHPLSILNIWEGGVAIYGAVIGGALGVYCYCRKKKIPFQKVLDIVVPGLLLAQAIGRWGNYFNMEAYGPVIDNPMFQFFPIGVQIRQNDILVWHMATFFYESAWNFIGFLALMKLRKKQTGMMPSPPGAAACHHPKKTTVLCMAKQEGNLFLCYLLIYGCGRFIIEQLREDSLWLGGIRVSQGLSLLLCVVSAMVLLWRAAAQHKRRFFVACLAALIAIARWFFLSTWIYAGLLLLLIGLGFDCIPRDGSALENGNGPLTPMLWLLLPLGIDVLGLACAQTRFLSTVFSIHLHALLCSFTLPFYILWFQQRLLTTTRIQEA